MRQTQKRTGFGWGDSADGAGPGKKRRQQSSLGWAAVTVTERDVRSSEAIRQSGFGRRGGAKEGRARAACRHSGRPASAGVRRWKPAGIAAIETDFRKQPDRGSSFTESPTTSLQRASSTSQRMIESQGASALQATSHLGGRLGWRAEAAHSDFGSRTASAERDRRERSVGCEEHWSSRVRLARRVWIASTGSSRDAMGWWVYPSEQSTWRDLTEWE